MAQDDPGSPVDPVPARPEARRSGHRAGRPGAEGTTGRAAAPYRPQRLAREPAHEHVAADLRAAIVSGRLAQGARLLNEAELSEAYGVSRPTVREALGNLVGEGLVTKVRGMRGGSFVTRASLARVSEDLQGALGRLGHASELTIEEVIEARELFEVPAARLAALHRTASDVGALEAAVVPPPGAPTSRRTVPPPVERSFHRTVAELSHNRLLLLAIEPINHVLQLQMDGRKYRPGFQAEIDAQHREVASAIIEGDTERSAALMLDHLRWLGPHYPDVWRSPTT